MNLIFKAATPDNRQWSVCCRNSAHEFEQRYGRERKVAARRYHEIRRALCLCIGIAEKVDNNRRIAGTARSRRELPSRAGDDQNIRMHRLRERASLQTFGDDRAGHFEGFRVGEIDRLVRFMHAPEQSGVHAVLDITDRERADAKRIPAGTAKRHHLRTRCDARDPARRNGIRIRSNEQTAGMGECGVVDHLYPCPRGVKDNFRFAHDRVYGFDAAAVHTIERESVAPGATIGGVLGSAESLM